MPQPHTAEITQTRYEVRFDWGVEGLRSIAPEAGVIVVVSALAGVPGELADAAGAFEVPVLAATLGNRTAVAGRVLAYQERLGRRANVAVVAAGGRRADGAFRPAVEDQLGAGAVIDALQQLGIDFCSPEAAAAAASFVQLRRAVGHLLTASVSGQDLAEAGRLDEVRLAARLDSSPEVPVLHEGRSRPE